MIAESLVVSIDVLLWPLNDTGKMVRKINKQTQTKQRTQSKSSQANLAVVHRAQPTCLTYEDAERKASAARRVCKVMQRGKTCSTSHFMTCVLHDWTYTAFASVFSGWDVCVPPKDVCGAGGSVSSRSVDEAIASGTAYRECRKAVLSDHLGGWLNFNQFDSHRSKRSKINGRGGLLVINKQKQGDTSPADVATRPVVKIVTSLYAYFTFVSGRCPGERYQLKLFVTSGVINESGRFIHASYSGEKDSIVTERVQDDQKRCLDYIKTLMTNTQ